MIPQEAKDFMYIPDGFYDPFGDPSYTEDYLPDTDMYRPIFVPVDNSKLVQSSVYPVKETSSGSPSVSVEVHSGNRITFNWEDDLVSDPSTLTTDRWNLNAIPWCSSFSLDGVISTEIYPTYYDPSLNANIRLQPYMAIYIKIILLNRTTNKPVTYGDVFSFPPGTDDQFTQETLVLNGILEEPWSSGISYAPILYWEDAKPTLTNKEQFNNTEYPVFSIIQMLIPRAEPIPW